MTETVTWDELKAEVLSQEVIEDLDEMIIYISDDTDGRPSDEEAEDECPQEEKEFKTAIFARDTLLLRRFRNIFLALLKRGLPYLERIVAFFSRTFRREKGKRGGQR